MSNTALTLYGFASIPLLLIIKPGSFPERTPEGTLFGVKFHAISLKNFECPRRIPIMLRILLALNYHVAYVYLHGLPKERLENFVDQALVGRPSFFKPKGITL